MPLTKRWWYGNEAEGEVIISGVYYSYYFTLTPFTFHALVSVVLAYCSSHTFIFPWQTRTPPLINVNSHLLSWRGRENKFVNLKTPALLNNVCLLLLGADGNREKSANGLKNQDGKCYKKSYVPFLSRSSHLKRTCRPPVFGNSLASFLSEGARSYLQRLWLLPCNFNRLVPANTFTLKHDRSKI